MKKLLNTLYITSPDKYLALDGENVVVLYENKEAVRFPLHGLEAIVTSGYTGASPALMGACAKRDISLCFMTQNGKFLARVTGKVKGNVILRKMQYRYSDDEIQSSCIAKNFLIGKIYNSKWIVERAKRDYAIRLDTQKLKLKSQQLSACLKQVMQAGNLEQLRGIEGEAAKVYFSVFDDLILQQKEDFYFHERNRRPPLDNVNALLSFIYSLTANCCTSALEAVGLDPYVGFMHRDRPGRASLALDLMEELRPSLADKFVLTLINKRIIGKEGFFTKENGTVEMKDEVRKQVLKSWQTKKTEVITHPFLEEKVEWGIVPYVQALLLARFIRGDIEEYPPFLWKT